MTNDERPNYGRLALALPEYKKSLADFKASEKLTFPWYPWETLSNIFHIGRILPAEYDYIFGGQKRFVDVGTGDGDMAFFLEKMGFRCDMYDYGPYNFNQLQGAYYIKQKFGSRNTITSVDLDSQFHINSTYDVIFFFGILYHLKNPYFILESLARHSRFLFLSTRVARFFAANEADVSNYAAAYLWNKFESNNDSTNYWLFTHVGLMRILERTGWKIIKYYNSNKIDSNPHDSDEREFVFAESSINQKA